MESVKVLLETQPLFTLFLAIAPGYLVGEIKGLSLGAGALLFVGLAVGGFAAQAERGC